MESSQMLPHDNAKRFLTSQEIEDILSCVTPRKGIPSTSAKRIVQRNQNPLRRHLSKQFIRPSLIPQLKKDISRQYNSSLIQPCTAVGVIAAQSIGEKQTQSTLNTFHFTGSSEKTVTSTVVRMNEITNVTSNPKNQNCVIYFKGNNTSLEELRQMIGHSLVDVRFSQLVKSVKITEKKNDQGWYPYFEKIYGKSIPKLPYFLLYKMNTDLMFEYKIDMKMIADRLEAEFAGLEVIFSPDQFEEVHVFVNFEEQKLEIPETESSHPSIIICLLESHIALENISICGIPYVENIFVEKDGNKGWKVETQGSNLPAILAHSNVDKTKTVSNDIFEIYHTFGIEAARHFLIEEFMRLVGDINKAHVKILIDKMTFTGTILSLTRYSVRKDNIGPFTAASFEESMDKFTNAAIFAQNENTNGISASVMCGKMAPFGTGGFDLHMDMSKLPD